MIQSQLIPSTDPNDPVTSLQAIRQEHRKRRAEDLVKANLKCALCSQPVFTEVRRGPYNVLICPSAARMLARFCKEFPQLGEKIEETKLMPVFRTARNAGIDKPAEEERTKTYGKQASELYLKIEKEYNQLKGHRDRQIIPRKHCSSRSTEEKAAATEGLLELLESAAGPQTSAPVRVTSHMLGSPQSPFVTSAAADMEAATKGLLAMYTLHAAAPKRTHEPVAVVAPVPPPAAASVTDPDYVDRDETESLVEDIQAKKKTRMEKAKNPEETASKIKKMGNCFYCQKTESETRAGPYGARLCKTHSRYLSTWSRLVPSIKKLVAETKTKPTPNREEFIQFYDRLHNIYIAQPNRPDDLPARKRKESSGQETMSPGGFIENELQRLQRKFLSFGS